MNKDKVRLENTAYFAIAEQRLRAGDRIWIRVRGESMLPFLRERDDVLLTSAGMMDIAVGDIVLARWGQRFVLHRLVRKKIDGWWLAGDHNLLQIEKVQPADVMALLIDARRNNRHLPVSEPLFRLLGMCWYYLRIPRRVLSAVRRRCSALLARQ